MQANIWYSCHTCNLDRRKVAMTARGSKEPLDDFMERVKKRVSFDHTVTSPDCEDKYADIFLATGDDQETIGGATVREIHPPEIDKFKPIKDTP